MMFLRTARVVLVLLLLVVVTAAGVSATGLGGRPLEHGSQGDDVRALQERLQMLGFLSGSVTGYFGDQTAAGVRQLQESRGLEPTGVVAGETLAELQFFTYEVQDGKGLQELAEEFSISVSALRALNGFSEDATLEAGDTILVPATLRANVEEAAAAPEVEQGEEGNPEEPVGDLPPFGDLLPWSEVHHMVARGGVIQIEDLSTGTTWEAVRYGGREWAHMDIEPRTAADTEAMRSIYGSWSWGRRAVIVTIGDRKIAGSINGMPHGGSNIKNNGFSGHHCLHFLGSKGHGSGRVCSQHQAAVYRAAGQ